MRTMSKRRLFVLLLGVCLMFAFSFVMASEEGYEPSTYATFWSLVPPIIAIGLALITKEVYSSLFLGILSGALIYSGFNLELTINTVVQDGLIANLSDSWNMGILVFLVVLGIMVALMNAAGGAAAFGRWAKDNIKTRTGAMFATFLLGVLIFVDDYFNCLTVGSVMLPITDTHKVSRAKLAYLIDATAAPICMIAPISSWAAAVSGVVEGYNGLELFIKAIPYNFYSLLTIVMVVCVIFMKADFGPMKLHEENAKNGDLFSTKERPFSSNTMEVNPNGRVLDLVLPVVVLIICCVFGMIYTGGFFAGETFVDSFANCDAALSLALGSLVALLFTFVYYLVRRVLSFKQITAAIPEGFKAMVPAILILTFAWGIKSMTGLLGADVFVSGIVESSANAESLLKLLPAIVFIVAVFLSFSTGTSWGTFGILLPIVTAVMPADSTLLIITISACLAGAVCGDHCSPISDTTIMASTGGQCDHVNHVSTQLPYALLVAAVSFVFYVIAGFVQSIVVLPLAIAGMILVMFLVKKTVAAK